MKIQARDPKHRPGLRYTSNYVNINGKFIPNYKWIIKVNDEKLLKELQNYIYR